MKYVNVDAERGLLSALLQGSAPPPVFRELVPGDFFHKLHRRFFTCFKSLLEDGQPLALVTIQDRMKLDGIEVAELAALLDPLLRTTKSDELAGYIRIVRRDARERELRRVCDRLLQADGDTAGLVMDLQGKTARYLESLSESSPVPGVLASTVKPQTVKWFWSARIPLGKITVIDGDPDKGKSLLTIDLAARCTSGCPMPDNTPGATGGAVLLSAEDDDSDTIIPRLIASGAALDRIRILRQIEVPSDIPVIRQAALSVSAVLIVVDPLMAFVGEKTNTWRDQDVRRALAPLAELAQELRAAIVVVRHLNKSTEGNPLYRGGGSIGIIGAARSGLVVGEDPDDETGEIRVLAVTKSNLSRKASSLRYRIEPRGDVVAITWLGESEHRAASLMGAPQGEQRSAVDEATRFIKGQLQTGARPASEIIAAAKKAGFSDRTVDRAKVRARVNPYLCGFGKDGRWMWELPTEGANA